MSKGQSKHRTEGRRTLETKDRRQSFSNFKRVGNKKKLHEMVWNPLLKHLETSSVHGVAHIVGADSSWPKRILWFLVLVLSLAYAGIMLESSIIGNTLIATTFIDSHI